MVGEQDHQLLLSSCALGLKHRSHHYGNRESFTLKPTIYCLSNSLTRQSKGELSRNSCSNCAYEQCFFLSDFKSEMVSVLLLMLAQLNRTGIRVHDEKAKSSGIGTHL